MGKIENSGIWEQIQKNVQETERLMGQKKYNLSMIKARQTMEFMVQLQCDKAGIVEGNPETMINDLYKGKWISKSTAEHYMQILELGNRATKEGDNSAYNANQAFHVLTQEIYAFVDADKTAKPRRSSTAKAAQAAQPVPPTGGNTRRRQTASSSSAPKNSRTSRGSRSAKKSSGLNTEDLLKLLIPIALIVVLIFLIKVLTPDKDPTNETTTAPQVSVEQQREPVAETPVETTSAEVLITYKTTTTLNVRSGPSTDAERIGKLDPDKTVEYLRDYDDFWAVILYNGQEAYVAKEYLTSNAQ